MLEAYFDLEHSFPPSHCFLEIEQNRIPENLHDCPDILRDHKCLYQLSSRRTIPRGEQGPSVLQTHSPWPHPKGALVPLQKMTV